MRTVHIFKAQPITENMPVESVTICIEQTVPDIPRYFSHCCLDHIVIESGLNTCVSCKQPCEQFDDSRNLLERSADRFDEQAHLLADALFSSLPQGVLDRLVLEFMRRRVSGYYGIDDLPLDRKLITWLESKKQTIELCFREGEAWSIEDLVGNSFASEDGSLRGALIHGYLHDKRLKEEDHGNTK